MKSDALNPQFNQRGRAEIDFLINMFKGSARIRQEANAELSEAVADVTALPDDLDERNDVISTTLSGATHYRAQNLIGEWHSRNHARICERAFEDIQDQLQPGLDALTRGPAKLFLDKNFEPPSYWDGVDFTAQKAAGTDTLMRAMSILKSFTAKLSPRALAISLRNVAGSPPAHPRITMTKF